VQCEALRGSSYAPLAQRVKKLLDEERFHVAHGAAWLRRLARSNPETRARMHGAVAAVLPAILAWFGPDGDRAMGMRSAGIVTATGSELRGRYVERMEPLLAELGEAGVALLGKDPTFGGFDQTRRRQWAGGPDAETIARVRGDKNRIFLVE